MFGVVAALLGVSACAESPVVPSEPWGLYNYQSDAFNSGWFELAPSGGTCELVHVLSGTWPCVVTDVTLVDTRLSFRFAAYDTAGVYFQHESELSPILDGTWYLHVPASDTISARPIHIPPDPKFLVLRGPLAGGFIALKQ